MRLPKLLLLILLWCAALLPAFAQQQTTPQLRVGWMSAHTALKGNSGTISSSNDFGVTAAGGIQADARFGLGGRLFIQPELGYIFRDVHAFMFFDTPDAFSKPVFKFDHLEMQHLQVGWQVGYAQPLIGRLEGYIATGIRTHIRMTHGELDANEESFIDLLSSFTITDITPGYHWSWLASGGVQYSLGARFRLFLNGAYFTDLSDFSQAAFSLGAFRTHGVNVSSGLVLAF